MVSRRPSCRAISVLVPTPSVAHTSTGSRMPGGDRDGRRKAAQPAEQVRHRGPPPPRRPASSAADQLDGTVARLHVDAGIRVRAASPAVLRCHGPAVSPGLPAARPRARTCGSRVVRHGHRVVAVEAGEAEAVARQVDARRARRRSRGTTSESAPTNSRISSSAMARRDELGLDLRVDAVEARVEDGRRADAQVDLGGARAAQQRRRSAWWSCRARSSRRRPRGACRGPARAAALSFTFTPRWRMPVRLGWMKVRPA